MWRGVSSPAHPACACLPPHALSAALSQKAASGSYMLLLLLRPFQTTAHTKPPT